MKTYYNLTDDERDTLRANADRLIRKAPSFTALRKAVKSHLVSLNKWEAEARMGRYRPHEMLTAHAGVWGAKSARAVTLKRLAGQVFAETSIPRRPPGMFRGEDGIDWEKFYVKISK